MVRALIEDPAERKASQSGSSPTTAARFARIVVVAFPRLRRNWLSDSAVLAACGNIGKALDAITGPRFLYWPGFRPGGPLSHRHAAGAALHQYVISRMYPPSTAPRHEYPAHSASCRSAWPAKYQRF